VYLFWKVILYHDTNMTAIKSHLSVIVWSGVEWSGVKQADRDFDDGSLTSLGNSIRGMIHSVCDSDSETSTDISHQTKTCQL
jgi:hypothetical protein